LLALASTLLITVWDDVPHPDTPHTDAVESSERPVA
jgi:hypothetical protein